MFEIFKDRNFGVAGIITLLTLTFIIGLLAFKARNDQWNVWKINQDITFYNGSPLLSTADGPYFVGEARVLSEGKSFNSFQAKRAFPEWDNEIGYNANQRDSIFETSLLPIVISYISNFFDNNLLLTSNIIIPFAALLTAISITIFFLCLGFGYEGVIAGIGASLSQSILIRTSIGRVDTDLLNIGFFYIITAFVFASIKTSAIRNKLIFISVAGFSNFIFNWWYHKPGFLILFLLTLVVLQTYCRQSLKISIYQILLFTFISGPIYVLYSVDHVISFAEVYLNFSPNLENELALSFPNTFNTITELQKLNFSDYAKHIFGDGKEWVVALGIIGLLLFSVFNFGGTLGMLPALVFLILSVFVGKRFAIYAVPLYWFGFSYLCLTLILFLNKLLTISNYIKINEIWIKLSTITISSLCLVFIIFSTSLADCKNGHFFNCTPKYIPAPTFSSRITGGFDYFKDKNIHTSSVVVTWWDYGYWLNFFSGLSSVNDGGTQRTIKTYLVANSLTSTSQKSSYNNIKYLVSSTSEKIKKDSSKNYDFFMNKISNTKIIDRPIYLFLSADMIRWWGSISYLGNWDIVNNKKRNQTSFVRIDCKPKSQSEMICGDSKDSILDVNTGSINNGNQLDSIVIVQNGKLIRRYDYKNKKGRSSLLIDIVNGQRYFYVVHPDTLNSTFSNLFFLNLPKSNMFTLVKDEYPHFRIFKLE